MKTCGLLILAVLLFSCGEKSDTTPESASKPLEDVLTLELSFGSELTGTPEEFLLTRTSGGRYWALNSRGDLFIGNEYSLKIFDEVGKGIIRIGQRGIGPGDFGSNPYVFINHSDYVATLNDRSRLLYSIYSPEFERLTTETFRLPDSVRDYINDRKPEITIGRIRSENKLWAYNENEIVFEIEFSDAITRGRYVLCLYKRQDIYKPLLLFHRPDVLRSQEYTSDREEIGYYSIYTLPDRKLMYFSTDYDSLVSANEAYYKIHIISINSGEETTIVQKFIPVPYPDFEKMEDYFKEIYSERWELLEKGVEAQMDYYKNREFLPSIEWITYDGDYIFVYHKKQFRSAEIFRVREDNTYEVDVFDMNTCMYVNTVTLPEIYFCMKNGFVYMGGKDKEDFPIIEKYRIDPAVYGK